MPEGFYLLNPPSAARPKRRHAPKRRATILHKRKERTMAKKQRHAKKRVKHWVKGHMSNPKRRHAKKARGLRRNPSTALVYGVANPKKRRHAKLRRSGGGDGGGLLAGFGEIGKLLNPNFLMQAAGAGVGLLAAILVPNWLFNTYPWYRGWVKQGVRAATGVLVFPLVTRMLPGAVQTGFASGVVAAVGVGAVAELLGRPMIVGPGASDVTATPQTLLAGLGAPVTKTIRNPFGATVSKMLPNPFGGVASDLGMSVVPHAAGRDLVTMLYDKNTGMGF